MPTPILRCSSTYQVNFTSTTKMSGTKSSDITLAPQKATEGFTAIVDLPADNDIIKIRQLLLTILMMTKWVILPTERYKHSYKKGAYLIPLVIALYDDTIGKDATRTEVHRSEGKHKARRNDHQLYKTADNACMNFIMEVVYETWYKELEDPDTFYTNVTALKLLDHLT